MNYFNTTKEAPEQVRMFSKENQAQDNIIVGIFQKAKRPLSGSDVFKLYPGNIHITSVRRAINVLCKEGLLEFTGNKKKSIYGRNEMIWQLVG